MTIESILSVGKSKGEMDFAISSTIADLSQEQMREFRAMVVVAIGTAEQMWRTGNESKTAHSQDGVIYNW